MGEGRSRMPRRFRECNPDLPASALTAAAGIIG
jgi:hypothetical protein